MESFQSILPHKPNTQSNQLIHKSQTPSHFTRTRHLSKSDWEERRCLGLCFGCGQKYTPQHTCTAGQLRIMLFVDGDKVSDEGEVRLVEIEVPDDTHVDGECQSL